MTVNPPAINLQLLLLVIGESAQPVVLLSNVIQKLAQRRSVAGERLQLTLRCRLRLGNGHLGRQPVVDRDSRPTVSVGAAGSSDAAMRSRRRRKRSSAASPGAARSRS